MQFQTLEHTAIATITDAFNKAFADYEVPLQFTPESLLQKIKHESIDLSVSVGAFDGDVLAGFIFFGIDTLYEEKTAWDGGTGVLPAYRGQRLTQRMFEYMHPKLKALGVKRVLLEVLQNNTGAQKIYKQIGFNVTRLLTLYKGNLCEKNIQHKIEVLYTYNAEQLLNIGDWLPTWQFTNTTIRNWGNAVTTICIRNGDDISAYAHYNDSTKRIYQFAVAKTYRRQGMATSLFSYIAGDNTIPISVINVDANSENSNEFLKAIGLTHFLSQYEMDMPL